MGRLKFDSTQVTALRTRLGLEALSGERRALVEARLDDLYESRGGDRAWAEAAEGGAPRWWRREAAARGAVADPETFRRRRLGYATAPAGAGADGRRRRRRRGGGGGGGERRVPQPGLRPPLRPAAPAQPWPAAAVGALTYHGIEPRAVGAAVGSVAKINQDRGVVVQPFGGSPAAGPARRLRRPRRARRAGGRVLHARGRRGPRAGRGRGRRRGGLEAALAAASARPTRPRGLGRRVDLLGTTAVVVVRLGGTLGSRQRGDSRAVVGAARRRGLRGGAAQPRPQPGPARRAAPRRGGRRLRERPARAGPERASGSTRRTRVGLAMSRSLGDGAAKRVGVVSDAEVRRHAVDVARDARSRPRATARVAVWGATRRPRSSGPSSTRAGPGRARTPAARSWT